jgi:fructose transport system substrate-binding protein
MRVSIRMGAAFAGALLAGITLVIALTIPVSSKQLTFSLITKTNENPVFVLEKQEAIAKAKSMGIKLLTFTGRYDGDNASQVTDIEDSIAARVDAIIIVPNDTKAIIPQIQEAQRAGIKVIVYDSPLDTPGIADGTFATDNYEAGQLIGKWLKATLGTNAGKARIAMLDADTLMVSNDVARDTGFLNGFGIATPNPKIWGSEHDSRVVGHQITKGSASLGQSAMEDLLQRDSSINVVYSMNEQAAAGAAQALKSAGRAQDVLSVSIDGTCAGLQMIKDGTLSATVMQFWLKMIDMSMDAAYNLLTKGEKPPLSPGLNYYDTGVTLVTDHPAPGVPSINADEALKLRGVMCTKSS